MLLNADSMIENLSFGTTIKASAVKYSKISLLAQINELQL
jgi:hypothetical protein